MNAQSADLYSLRIPFVQAFRHSAKARGYSDSVVLRIQDDQGNVGFGEAVARPYVTGETPESVREHIEKVFWPSLVREELSGTTGGDFLSDVFGRLESVMEDIQKDDSVIAPHAACCAVELALFDCWLKGSMQNIGQVIEPRRQKVTYSAVLSAGSIEQTLKQLRQVKASGLISLKVKVGGDDDVERLRKIRNEIGPDASIRIDANGAWSVEEAIDVLEDIEQFGIAYVEEPLPRSSSKELPKLRSRTSIPIVADESLITVADAESLIASESVDALNVRVSKCGGLYRSLQIADRATEAGIGVGVGAQVGETAILSAAGRALAANLNELAFAEGSFGTLLLTEDLTREDVRFGYRGEAPLLDGPGLGVAILNDRVEKYATSSIKLEN